MYSKSPFPKEQATKLIKEIVKKSLADADYSIGYTDHFRVELRNDKLDINDAHYILKSGIIHDEPEFDTKYHEWRYRVEGKPIDSKSKVILVITFSSATKIKFITIFKKGKK